MDHMSVTDIPSRELEADIETHPLMTEFGEAMTNGRAQRIIGVYKLHKLLRTKPPFLHEQILSIASQRFAGGAIEGLRQDLRWVERVDLDDLLHVFDDHGIDSEDIFKFLTLTHFRTVAKVKATSRERCELLAYAHHENMFTKNFEDWLTANGHLTPKKESTTDVVWATDVLKAIARQIKADKLDANIAEWMGAQGEEPVKVGLLLRFLASKYPNVDLERM